MDDRTTATPDETPGSPTRRLFCQTLTMLAVGTAFPACGGGGGSNPGGPSGASNLPILSGTLNGNTVTVAVDSIAVGSAALVNAGNAAVLVARTGASDYAAFSAGCTHENCTITTWAAPNFQCPCHGARFDTAGQVVRGPASRALTKYTTSLSGTTLTITG